MRFCNAVEVQSKPERSPAAQSSGRRTSQREALKSRESSRARGSSGFGVETRHGGREARWKSVCEVWAGRGAVAVAVRAVGVSNVRRDADTAEHSEEGDDARIPMRNRLSELPNGLYRCEMLRKSPK